MHILDYTVDYTFMHSFSVLKLEQSVKCSYFVGTLAAVVFYRYNRS